MNAYAYCTGDPVNRVDPSGHAFNYFRHLRRSFERGVVRQVDPVPLQQALSVHSPSAPASVIADLPVIEPSPIRYGPLTKSQAKSIKQVSKFISKRHRSQRLFEKAALKTPSSQLDDYINRLPVNGKTSNRLKTLRDRRKKESGYAHFAEAFQSANSDQLKLDLLFKENMGTMDSVALSDLPEKLAAIIHAVRF